MSSQVAQYRLLENAESILSQTGEILEKIANISKEVQTGGASNDVTNYKIEPVWLKTINIGKDGDTDVTITEGQAYVIKARIDDLEFVGQLMKEITLADTSKRNVNITDDVIEGCVLAGGKLYKATTLELIPVAVTIAEDTGIGDLTLSTFAFAPLTQINVSNNIYTYNPKTNTVGRSVSGSIKISKQVTLSKGDKYYYASIGTTTVDDDAVYYVQEIVPAPTGE